MATKWFDGTFPYSTEKLTNEFPVEISPCLRISEDWKTLALINRTEEGSFLNDISEPDFSGKKPFFYVSFGAEGEAEKKVIVQFLQSAAYLEDAVIKLFREEQGELYMYAHGHIPKKLLKEQRRLREALPADIQAREPFVLPLKVFLHPCPVCRHRTLLYRGYYMICDECGWEDECGDNEDEEGAANGDWTIRTYQEEYLKLKAKDPDYNWWSAEGGDDSAGEKHNSTDKHAFSHFLKYVESRVYEEKQRLINKQWHDAKRHYCREYLEDEFPIEISSCMRLSEDGKMLAIISCMEEETYTNLVFEPDFEGRETFFHVSYGTEAAAERMAVNQFLQGTASSEDGKIKLFRQEQGELFMYAYGIISGEWLGKVWFLYAGLARDPQCTNTKDYFVLPLKVFLFPCPVCGQKTLLYRGCYMYCDECGWEDEGIDDEDKKGVINGDWTIRTYRENYLKRKAVNPNYCWWNE